MEKVLGIAVKGIVACNGKILIVQRCPGEKYNPLAWEFPGGKIEFGEKLEEALHREIREEVSLAVTVDGLLYASMFFPKPTRQVVILTYACTAEPGQVVLSDEHVDFKWATRAEAEALLEGNILDDIARHDVFAKLKID